MLTDLLSSFVSIISWRKFFQTSSKEKTAVSAFLFVSMYKSLICLDLFSLSPVTFFCFVQCSHSSDVYWLNFGSYFTCSDRCRSHSSTNKPVTQHTVKSWFGDSASHDLKWKFESHLWYDMTKYIWRILCLPAPYVVLASRLVRFKGLLTFSLRFCVWCVYLVPVGHWVLPLGRLENLL